MIPLFCILLYIHNTNCNRNLRIQIQQQQHFWLCLSSSKCLAVRMDKQEPVSPSGRMLGTSEMSLCVHVVAEMVSTVDILHAKKSIMEVMLPKHHRFSCILTEDENGVAKWVETEVDINQHVIVPEFPPGLEFYDEFVEEYISDLHIRQLPRDKPLWEFHFINYKTRAAPATTVFNVHHQMGDGVSLLSLARACQDPSPTENKTPASAPQPEQPQSQSQRKSNNGGGIFRWILIAWYTLTDIFSNIIRFKLMGDNESPMKGPPSVRFLPRNFGSAKFSLSDVQLIKNAVGGTVNDVVMGIIFCGVQRYVYQMLKREHGDGVDVRKKMKGIRSTVLALMSTRSEAPKKQELSEMTKPKSQNPWGNRFGFLPLPMPMEQLPRAVDYVLRAKAMIDRKKLSYAAYFTGKVLAYVMKLKGPKTSSKAMYNMLKCTSFTASNVIGSSEVFTLGSIAVKSWYFCVSGVPQALAVSIMSYAGKVRIQVVGAKGVIDAELLSQCFASSFEDIKAETISSPPIGKKYT